MVKLPPHCVSDNKEKVMLALAKTIFVAGLIGRVKLGYVSWISKMTKRKQSFSFSGQDHIHTGDCFRT
jgi:hypothetical protein